MKCLNSLFQTSCYSKLEKADILEMTVRYLRSVRNQNMTGRQNWESLISEYQQCVVCYTISGILLLYNTNDSSRVQLAINACTSNC